MIKTVIRTESGMAVVLDQNGEQMPRYQGPWEEMKEEILRDASPSAVIFGPKSIHLLREITI